MLTVAVLSDGRIVSGSWDKTLRIYDASTGQCVRMLEGVKDGYMCTIS